MTSRIYGSLVPTANIAIAAQKNSSRNVSIGWWLIPSVMFYLLAIALFR
jgi:hypothetical protein